MALDKEILGLLRRLGFECDGSSVNLAELLQIIFDENDFLDKAELAMLDEKIRTQNDFRTA